MDRMRIEETTDTTKRALNVHLSPALRTPKLFFEWFTFFVFLSI